jgi:hypothetical protein
MVVMGETKSFNQHTRQIQVQLRLFVKYKDPLVDESMYDFHNSQLLNFVVIAHRDIHKLRLVDDRVISLPLILVLSGADERVSVA